MFGGFVALFRQSSNLWLFWLLFLRATSLSEVKEAVKEAIQLKRDFPDVVAGFDLVKKSFSLVQSASTAVIWITWGYASQVGREDSGRTLWYFREALSIPADTGAALPFFFHAGETGDYIKALERFLCCSQRKWQLEASSYPLADDEGTEVDQNILDALLFNTSRIGHGYALAHHPLAKEMSQKRNVAVELCPISNQVYKVDRNLSNSEKQSRSQICFFWAVNQYF